MARDTSLGFKYEGRECGGEPTILTLPFSDTETLTKGDMLNLETGEVDLAVAGDSGYLGACRETKAGTASTTEIEVYSDPDSLYSVFDNNARVVGATLDLDGTTGIQTVTTSSHADFTVVETSTANQRTLVRITHGEHYKN